MNRIIIHCGDGRGKSSSGFGVVVRSLAHGKKVLAAQFFKPQKDAALEYLLQISGDDLTVRNYGSWYFADRPDEKAPAMFRKALQEIIQLIQQQNFDTVLLDEIFYTVDFKLLEVEEIINVLNLFDGKCFILTGRNAPEKMIEIADTVSCIQCRKHAYEQGIKAQNGVEF